MIYFISHGSPMLLIKNNDFTDVLKNQEKRLKLSNYIIILSPHWLTEEPMISESPSPIIYDFYGFPEELYTIKYEAFTDEKVVDKIASKLDLKKTKRGLDHGAWALLYHMLKDASLPIVQISIPAKKDFDFYIDFGKKLSYFKEEASIIFSGGAIHNLMLIKESTDDWAYEFSEFVKNAVLNHDIKSLKNFKHHRYGNLAHPTTEHFIPLFYFMGACQRPTLLYDGFEMGNLSLLSFGCV